MNLKDYPTLHLDKLVKEGAAFINVQHPTGPIISKTHTSKPRTSVKCFPISIQALLSISVDKHYTWAFLSHSGIKNRNHSPDICSTWL